MSIILVIGWYPHRNGIFMIHSSLKVGYPRSITRLAFITINKALLLRTRHLVLDSELQFGPSSRRARSTVPSTYAAQKKLSKQNATALRQESRFTYSNIKKSKFDSLLESLIWWGFHSLLSQIAVSQGNHLFNYYYYSHVPNSWHLGMIN